MNKEYRLKQATVSNETIEITWISNRVCESMDQISSE